MGKIAVIGSLNYDITVTADHLPKIGETILGKTINYNCGGKGGNQAYACACAGSTTIMLGAIGKDSWGEHLKTSLRNLHINTDYLQEIPYAHSGVAIVAIDDQGKNSIIVIPGANFALTEDLLAKNIDQLKSADVLLLQLEIPLPTVYYAIEKAYTLGKPIILNPAPVQQLNPKYLAMIDYLTPNETELHQLVPGNSSLAIKACQLIDAGVRNVVVTLGENGVMYVNQSRKIRYYPARKVTAIDTVGAGDCFNGYFSSAIANNKSPEEAIKYAIVAASVSVTRVGAQASIPTQKEIDLLRTGEDFSV